MNLVWDRLQWTRMLMKLNTAVCFVSLQVLIKPKPVFQTMVSEQTRQLVTETLQQVTRSADVAQGQTSGSDGSAKDEVASFTEASSLAGESSHGSTQGIRLLS